MGKKNYICHHFLIARIRNLYYNYTMSKREKIKQKFLAKSKDFMKDYSPVPFSYNPDKPEPKRKICQKNKEVNREIYPG